MSPVIPLLIVILLVVGSAALVRANTWYESDDAEKRDFALLPAIFGFLLMVSGIALLAAMLCLELAKRSVPIA